MINNITSSTLIGRADATRNLFSGIDQKKLASHLRNLADDIEAGNMSVDHFATSETISEDVYGVVVLNMRMYPRVKRPSKKR